jgi:hypothetical protein
MIEFSAHCHNHWNAHSHHTMPKRGRAKNATSDSQAPPPPPNPATASSAPESERDRADVYIDDDDESDGDIDVEELEAIMHDVCIDAVDAREILRSAALGRVNIHTREAYDLNIRQCALWAQSTAQFQHEVTGTGSNVQLKWPLNEEVVVGFISYLQQKQVSWSHTNPPKMKHLAPSTISHIFSAFRDLYNVHGDAIPNSLDTFFSNTYRKYVLFISQQKLDGLYPDTINSAGFSVSIFEAICDKLAAYWTSGRGACNATVRYLRLFFIFCFVLLGRGERVGRLRYQWMSWSDDSMLVKIPTTKSDQSGALSYFKRVYANALNPSVCPILALAIEVFSRDSTVTDRVFPGVNHDVNHANSFRKFLNKTFGTSVLGIATCRITNHSAKRSGIMAVSDAEVIQWHNAELRADHKCGVTSNYQTSPAPQQDGIMGRILSCLPFGEAQFNIPPPHFDAKDIAHIALSGIVPQFESYESDFKMVIPFLFASLIFHWNWIEDSIPQNHPIHTSKFAVLHNRQVPFLQSKVLGGRAGALSLLKVTGNSCLSDMHITCKQTKVKVDDIYSMLQRGAISPNGVIGIDHTLSSMHDLNAAVHILIQQNTQLLKMQQFTPNAPASHVVGHRQRPVFYLNQSFRLPNGIKPEGLFLKWFVPDGSIPAYKDITNAMLPDSDMRRSQETLLSKFRTLMKYMIGTTPPHVITRDVTVAFQLCWCRLQKLCCWPCSSLNDAAITVYGKIPLHQRVELQETPVLGFNSNQFIHAATMAVHAAAVARAAAAANGPLNDASLHAAALADAFMQASTHAIEVALVADSSAEAAVEVAHATDAAVRNVVLPHCVPRGSAQYPVEGPRPPLDRSSASQPALVMYSAFAQSNAPRTGAEACWACPYCVTASSRGAFQAIGSSMRRHVRTEHKSSYDANSIGVYLNVSPLIWCTKCATGGQSGGSWEPVLIIIASHAQPPLPLPL